MAAAVSSADHTWGVDLRRRRTANGGWEWFFQLGRVPVYPTTASVGVFTGPGVRPEDAFALVMGQWASTLRST